MGSVSPNAVTTIVNGQPVPLTPAQASAIQAEWNANATTQQNMAYWYARQLAYPSLAAIVEALYQNSQGNTAPLQAIVSQRNAADAANPPPNGVTAQPVYS